MSLVHPPTNATRTIYVKSEAGDVLKCKVFNEKRNMRLLQLIVRHVTINDFAEFETFMGLYGYPKVADACYHIDDLLQAFFTYTENDPQFAALKSVIEIKAEEELESAPPRMKRVHASPLAPSKRRATEVLEDIFHTFSI